MLALIAYLIVMNVLGYGLMGHDKARAQKRGRRVPEKRLFTVALAGGALGSWIGMRSFRHKTKHKSFILGIPALLVLNAACVYGIAILIR